MAVKGTALLLLPLLQGASAEWITTIKTQLLVPNTVAPVVDYVPTPSTSARKTETPIPSSYDHARSHQQQFTSVVTVPDGRMPTIHFSPVMSTSSSTPAIPGVSTETETEIQTWSSETTLTKSTALSVAPAVPSMPSSNPVIPQGMPAGESPPPSTPTSTSASSAVAPGSPTEASTETISSSSPVVPPPRPSSSIPVAPGPSGTPSSSVPLPPSSDEGSTPVAQPSPPSSSLPVPPGSAGMSSSSASAVPSSSPVIPPSDPTSDSTSATSPGGMPSGSTSPSSPSTSDQQTTSGQSPPSSDTTPAPQSSSAESFAASDQLTSADLTSASDLDSLSAAATDSDTAIAQYAPTGSPTSEPWSSTTELPSGTITGSPANTEASNIAVLLRNSYNNIEDLKKDPEDYKRHIEDIDTQSKNYLDKANFDSTKSPCSTSKKRALVKRDLFGAVDSLASEAAGATVDTAKGIADAAISCVGPIADEITKDIPEDPADVTEEVEDKVTKGTEYFDEISNIVEDMENKVNEDEDDDSSESESSDSSDSSTSESSTSSCTSSTTFSDCTWSTIISSTPAADTGSATMSTTSTEVCTTQTACEADPTTTSTTSTVGVCPSPYYVSAPSPVPVTPLAYSGSAAPGSAASTALTSLASSTAPPNAEPTTSERPGSTFQTSASSTKPPSAGSDATASGSPTTSSPSSCQAHFYVDQVNAYTYCQFDCDAFTGKYPTATSTSGMSDYQPCPYSTPPTTTWSASDAGSYTTTATDGTVYYCGDSQYANANVNDAKQCVTSMSSMSVVPSIHSSWTASQASASSASAASASSASAAAATPTDQIYITYDDNIGSWSVYWRIFNIAMDTDPSSIDWCSTNGLAEVEASGDIALKNVPNPPSIEFNDAKLQDEAFKDCSYDGDTSYLTCPDFGVQCKWDIDNLAVRSQTCHGISKVTKFVPKVWCAWGEGDMNS